MALAHAHVEPLLTRGERLRLARERSGLSVNEFADRVQRHRNNVARWEARYGSPSLETIAMYAEVCGNTTEEWLAFELGEWPTHATEPGSKRPGPSKYAPRDLNPEPADYRHDETQLNLLRSTPEPLHLFTLAA